MSFDLTTPSGHKFNWHLGFYESLCFLNLNNNIGNNFGILYLQNILQLIIPDVKKDL